MRNFIKIIALSLAASSFLTQAAITDFSIDDLDFYKNKHIDFIVNKCEISTNKENCILTDIKYFYSGLKLLTQPYGDVYYKKCYFKNFENNTLNYETLNTCTRNYYNTLSYDFLNKKYNHIFLEEGYIMNNITQICNNTHGDVINLNYINDCIKKEQKSFKFFKLNFFNNLSFNAEEAFEYCLKTYQYSNYSFNFTAINSCIKLNTSDFKANTR